MSAFDELKAKAQNAGPSEDATEYTVTWYRNGFTINDGDLHSAESADGVNFLKRLQNGFVPHEIEAMEAAKGRPLGNGGPQRVISVRLDDKRGEDWALKMDSQSLFKRGGGAQIGKKEDCSTDGHCLLFTEASTSASSAGPAPVFDPAQPSTQLAVKGPDGKTAKFKVNSSIAVGQLGAVLVQTIGLPHGGERGFTVSCGFPPKCLEAKDSAKTLLEAGVTNAQISQILK